MILSFSFVLGGIWTQLSPRTQPHPPNLISSALFAFEPEGYVFFGGTLPNGNNVNVTMFFDTREFQWRHLNLKGPSARSQIASCKSTYHEEEAYFIHGGDYHKRDLWLFKKEKNGEFTWQLINAAGPELRSHQMVNYEDALFLYGGYNANSRPSDALWVYNITLDSWERVFPSIPWPGEIERPR